MAIVKQQKVCYTADIEKVRGYLRRRVRTEQKGDKTWIEKNVSHF